MLICGGAPHVGHAVANELIFLPHLEHGIKAIGGSVVTRSCCRCQIPFKPSQLINIADAHRSDGKRYVVHGDEIADGVCGTGIGNLRGNMQLSPFGFIALLDLLALCLRKPRVKRLDGFRLRDHRISDDVQ